MSKPTVEQFKDFVEAQDDLEIKWYGKYDGRWYHKGYAVTGDSGHVGALVERMATERFADEMGWWDHQDTYGYDVIVSWDVDTFDD